MELYKILPLVSKSIPSLTKDIASYINKNLTGESKKEALRLLREMRLNSLKLTKILSAKLIGFNQEEFNND